MADAKILTYKDGEFKSIIGQEVQGSIIDTDSKIYKGKEWYSPIAYPRAYVSPTSNLEFTQLGNKSWTYIVDASSEGGTDIKKLYGIDSIGNLYKIDVSYNSTETRVDITEAKISDKRWRYIRRHYYNFNYWWFAIDADGYLYGWGDNDYGQLGLGDTTSRYEPTKVGDKKWKSVTGYGFAIYAIDSDGYLYAWGVGNLGIPGTSSTSSPVRVCDILWASIYPGLWSLAIDIDGYLYAWGENEEGQLGLGDKTKRYEPTKVGDKKWRIVVPQYSPSCSYALDIDGYFYVAGTGSDTTGAPGVNNTQFYKVTDNIYKTIKNRYIIDHSGHYYRRSTYDYSNLQLLNDKRWKALENYYAIDTEGWLYHLNSDYEYTKVDERIWDTFLFSLSNGTIRNPFVIVEK